jgi:hypothetical protein
LRLRAGALCAALALCACASQSTTGLPAHPVAPGPAITVESRPVPLSRAQPNLVGLGAFTYDGGLELTSPDTARLHGLSDLKVSPDGRLVAVSDDGDLLTGKLRFDAQGRLAGLTDAELSPLSGEDGQPLSARGKAEADAEGVAVLADGARLVSLECDDRILLYPANGGRPRRAPSPNVAFPYNLGMEALAADPAAGPDAYVVGGESSGQTWLCRLSGGCEETARVADLPADGGLTAVAPLPGGGRAYLIRAFSPLKGVRVTLRITGPDGATLDELKLASPLTVDNFEGLAAAPLKDGGIRFYLISDDNFSGLQRTLLLALDWKR